MNVKLIQAIGLEEIGRIEDQINGWLETLPSRAEVKRSEMTLSHATMKPDLSPTAHLIVIVWWDGK
jgi:hypothetical protein